MMKTNAAMGFAGGILLLMSMGLAAWIAWTGPGKKPKNPKNGEMTAGFPRFLGIGLVVFMATIAFSLLGSVNWYE